MIIVTGGRRTGTTLLANVICASEETVPAMGEAQLLTQLLRVMQWARDTNNFNNFVRYTFPDLKALDEYFRAMVLEYARRTRKSHGDVRRVVFKNPEYSLHMDDMCRLLPEARFVVAVRDPRDQIASELDVERRYERLRGTSMHPAARRDVVTMARTLNRYYAGVFAAEARCAERIHFIRYRDLVLGFDEAVAGLSRFVGLDLKAFDPASDWPRFLDKESSQQDNYTDFSPLYGKAVEGTRVGRHREVLTPVEVRWIEEECGALMERFGYAPADLPPVTPTEADLEARAARLLRAGEISTSIPSEDLRHWLSQVREIKDHPGLSEITRARLERLRSALRSMLDWQAEQVNWRDREGC